MSIHKSKGLEFPIVFLADTGKKFNMRDTFGDLLLHKDLGIALKEVDPEARTYRTSLPQLAIQKAIENESLSEELRILYVALTRAVDRLYITGATRQFDKALTGWQRGCTSFAMRRARTLLDWMASYAVGGEGVGPAKWHWRVVPAADMIRSQNKASESSRHLVGLLNQAAGMTLPAELLKRLEGSKTPEVRLLPAKVSVTELKVLDDFDQHHTDRNATLEALYRPQLNETPKFLGGEDRAALGAARGSAYHIILQNLSFEKMSKASIEAREALFEEERADLISKKRIDPERAAEITWPELSGFFNHPMFSRLAASSKIEREKAFVVRRGSGEDFTMIQGIIDLYFEEAEGLVLIDYKTDRLEGPGSSQILKDRYSPQLRLYAQALTKLKNMPVTSAWIYASSGGRWIEADLEHKSEERREPI
jgi:ATP-dependent helicase/nuclease subunit A